MLFEILAPCQSIISKTINNQNLGFNYYNKVKQRVDSTFNEHKEIHIYDDSISFVITNKLKTTKRDLKPKIVKCVNSSDPALDVCAYVKTYMHETSKLKNENHDDLFLPRATKKPGTKVSLGRSLKTILSLSIIDTKDFLLTHIEVLHYPLQIKKAGDWTNVDTSLNHYYAHASDTPVGRIVLNESPLEG